MSAKGSGKTGQFLTRMVGVKSQKVVTATDTGELPPTGGKAPSPEMSAVIQLQNQPEFWADAPWRLEFDQDVLPVSFHVRDANLQPPGKGPWRLVELRVDQRLASRRWHTLARFGPSDVPEIDQNGYSRRGFWVFGTGIALGDLRGVERGRRVHLRAVFVGEFPKAKREVVEIHLETFLAAHGLPLGRVDTKGPRHWFYGDTHYHSAYSNDIKEFGGAVREARRAGQAIGLDWLIVTDHSCDLDERDMGPGNERRWDLLKADIASPLISNDAFRFILGEEITLLGQSGEPLHMLAFGAMTDMIDGAFLSNSGDDFKMELARKALEHILKASSGYSGDVAQRLFGPIHPLAEVLARLPAETLAFAAHPFDIAQVPPAKWGDMDLTHPRLNGYEFWNGRIRVAGRFTTNPFDRRSWTDEDKLRRADAERIARLRQRASDEWDPQLRRGVDAWRAGDERPAWRPILIAGSDAHGDFNYHVGWAWTYEKFEVDDNALGRARTVVYLPDYAGPGVPEAGPILAAIEKGSAVVTDGPVVDCRLEHGGHVARLGEVLPIAGGGEVALTIAGHSTAEFGAVQQADVVSYMTGMPGPQRTAVQVGVPATLHLEGRQGYFRVEAQTAGPEGEGFCCLTNPIWLRNLDGAPRDVRVTLA